MEDAATARFHDSLKRFKVYEEYLESKVTTMDLFNLKSMELARAMVENGHTGPVLSREEFEERKAAEPMTLASAGKELKDNFLKALAEREEANRSGKMTSVIFIRDHNTLGQEVSGYIDYAHGLETQDFEPYFSGKKKLMPKHSDLCFYNWKTQVSISNPSSKFEVIYENPNGLLFKSKVDKKILNVDPMASPGENSIRTFLQSDLYMHVVIYDHNFRTF